MDMTGIFREAGGNNGGIANEEYYCRKTPA
jgi:hypothetical protein